MKKVWKLILTISFSVAGVGLVFIAAGYILGASSSEVDELFYNAGGYAHLGRIEEMARDMTGRTHHEEHGTEYDPGLDYIESGEEYYGSEEHSYDGIDSCRWKFRRWKSASWKEPGATCS